MRLATALSLATVLLVVLSCETVGASQEDGFPEKTCFLITKRIVWSTDGQAVQAATQRCSEYRGRGTRERIADAMEGLGPFVEAASLARSLGCGAIAGEFRGTGFLQLEPPPKKRHRRTIR